jgi:hypothetical protein
VEFGILEQSWVALFEGGRRSSGRLDSRELISVAEALQKINQQSPLCA